MRFSGIRIENYKSFLHQRELKFEPGFNILVGSNNSGKTNVLGLLDSGLGINDPHVSIQTVPQFGGTNSQLSAVTLSFVTSFRELHRIAGASSLTIPSPRDGDHAAAMADWFRTDAPIELHLQLCPALTGVLRFPNGSVVNFEDGNSGNSVTTISGVTPDKVKQVISGNVQRFVQTWHQQFSGLIYRFSVERRPAARCAASQPKLEITGGNLAYCINHLQTNDAHGHARFCDLVNRVFPEVKWVQSVPVASEFQLKCLPVPPSARRHDLARGLDTMGAGIGNVISMLYVLLTARFPQVIAIDEPNAFLHPRALRELFAILESEGAEHQYLISAHSPDVLTSVRPSTISLLRLDADFSTGVTHVGPDEIRHLQDGLSELGIRVTDLHARDRVLWVEGQTEEKVLPMLLKWAVPQLASSTAVLRVEHTGTFDKKNGIDPVEVAKVYERLSGSSGLVPPAVGMLLDSENRKPEAVKDIESRSGGKIRFLKRTMLEDYVLYAPAVAAVLATLNESVPAERVEEILVQVQGRTSNAGQILRDVFNEVTEARHAYRKTTHTPLLFEWLIANDESMLSSLKSEIETLFGEPI